MSVDLGSAAFIERHTNMNLTAQECPRRYDDLGCVDDLSIVCAEIS